MPDQTTNRLIQIQCLALSHPMTQKIASMTGDTQLAHVSLKTSKA